MSKPQVIVCERTGKWASALRQSLGRAIGVSEVRSRVECTAALRLAPTVVLALEVGEELPVALAFIVRAGREFPRMHLIALAERDLQPHEWLLREAGAAHVAYSLQQMPAIASLVARHVRGLPAERASLAAQIWDELPWAGASSV